MSRTVIFCGGIYDMDFTGEYIHGCAPFDFCICTDSGLEAAYALKVPVDVIVGDHDSVDMSVYRKYVNRQVPGSELCKIYEYPSEKDENDLEIAVRLAAGERVKDRESFYEDGTLKAADNSPFTSAGGKVESPSPVLEGENSEKNRNFEKNKSSERNKKSERNKISEKNTNTEINTKTPAGTASDKKFIEILGATGGRIDQFLANINILKIALDCGADAVITDRCSRLRLVRKHFSIKRNEQFGRYISFLPYTDICTGVTLEGFKYPLKDTDMLKEGSLGVSNEIVSSEACLTFDRGIMTVIESRDRDTKRNTK